MSSRLGHVRVEQQIAAELGLLTQLPSFLFLKAPLEIKIAEAHALIHGSDPDVFLEPGGELPLDVDDAWLKEFALLHSDRGKYARDRADGQARVRAHWPNRRFLIKKLNHAFRSDGVGAVERFARRFMGLDRAILGLSRDRKAWPKPQSFRSVWAQASYLVMYAHANEESGRKPDPNDFHDMCHFTAAAHADVFVTNDGFSRRVAERCPPPRPEVKSFEDWAEGVLT